MEISRGFTRPILLPNDNARPASGEIEADGARDDAAVDAMVRMVQSSDEMSAALTQFRNRRNFELQSENSLGSFEQVLEDNTVPKAQQILALARSGERPVEWLLQMMRRLFPDDSDLVLVLRELLRGRELSEAVRQRLEKGMALVMAQASPRALKAGINCALKARLFGKTLKLRARLLRATYRGFLENEDGAVDTYEDWISLYGADHRSSVLDFIEAALLTDISAQDPSCSCAEFGELLGKLSSLKQLRSADNLFVAQLLASELLRSRHIGESELLVLMFGLLRYPDELDQLLDGDLASALLLARHAERSAVLRLLGAAVLNLPLSLFPDEQALERVDERLRQLASLAHAQELLESRRSADSSDWNP